MAGQQMHYWTFTGLVGAFIDLIIAYFLLSASTFVFFASKFLGLFGFSLPSPCNGLFGIPNSNYSFQTLLADCSMDKVSSVQSSIKSRLPFISGSILGRDQNYNVNYDVMKLDRDGNSSNGVEFEGEGSGDKKELQIDVKRDSFTPRNENGNGKERKFDMKGKGVMNQRVSGGFRRRRKQHKASQLHGQQNGKVDNNFEPVGATRSNYEMEASRIMESGERDSYEIGVNQPLDDNEKEERISDSVSEFRNEMQRHLVFDDDEKTTVIVLEQALEEEHAARAALYVELEQERNAAASAADEAMAMILRLQEEKATIEMEARQYQRIIEEKSAYDAEEMNILKEILFRRETEKHFLEKEVEAYRHMLYQQSDSEGEIQDTDRENFVSQFDPTEDTGMMLHQLNESISNNKMPRTKNASSKVTSASEPNSSLPIAKGFPVQGRHEDSDPFICINEGEEPKEKEMVSVDDNLCSEAKSLSSYQEEKMAEKTIPIVGKEHRISGNQRVGIKTVEAGIYVRENSQNLGNYEKDVSEGFGIQRSLTSDEDPDVLDIHIVDDETKLGDKFSGNKFKKLAASDSSKIHRTSDLPREAFLIQRNDAERCYPSTSRSDYETDSNKSISDVNIEQPGGSYSGRPPLPDLRRNSMTALDTERSKIDTEVEWLRERLRVVQQGREKLKVSKEEYPERERLQLQLLESIACQLREIQQLTEPGKALRQGSLPPPSSKVLSKKRRCRSVSIELEKSS